MWGNPDRGVQLFGVAREVGTAEEQDAERIYRARFPESGSTDVLPYRFYDFRPQRVKLFDEGTLGPGVFITARLRRDGRPEWERTEIYKSREWELANRK